ncbi:MAG: hypothetical protein JWM96_432 [Alphaproteobacteria bacterium]|nr:hypothetical protein [Alphaproteobacteria bacterium]
MLIPPRIHGLIDYSVAVLLIAAPWLLGFQDNGTAMLVPVSIGIATIVMSLLSRYKYGVLKLIPFSLHLLLDTIAGIVLAISPWAFDFSRDVYAPHLAAGLFSLLVVALSMKTTIAQKRLMRDYQPMNAGNSW